MREILFRGKKLRGDGAWATGSLLTYADGTCFICCQDICPDVLNKYEVDPDTVGQYTGQTDKNGRRIFEGDILRWTAEDGESGRVYVEFARGLFGLHSIECPNTDPDTFADFEAGEQPLEVIGNVHDDPELMEKQTNVHP